MENPKNTSSNELATNIKDYLKWSFRSSFIREKQFHSELIGIHKTNTLNKITQNIFS